MPKTVTCVCGQSLPIDPQTPDATIPCPSCGRVLRPKHRPPESPVEQEASRTDGDPTPAEDTKTDSHHVDAAKHPENGDAAPPLWLRLLLDPQSIQRLLGLGGGLAVLGLIAWLVSLGVFEDPRVVAAALGAGTLALLGAGWWVTLCTGHRLAGQALTFLACVVAPLNLWFYDAQGLVTSEGHLWVAGLVCTLLYLATVRILKEPLFLYAVEMGVTLTAMLLLGDFGRMTDSSSLCMVLVALAALSIHAEALFDLGHPVYNRKRFGLPLFFSGQVQLAGAMLSLLCMQGLAWSLSPQSAADWGYSQIAASRSLAGSLWLVAAYLWLYSDLAVRRLGVYSYVAALAVIFAEITLLQEVLVVEGLMVTLAVTALAVHALARSLLKPENPWSIWMGGVGLLIAAVPCGMGIARHLHSVLPGITEGIPLPLLFAGALWVVAACEVIQGFWQRKQAPWTLSGFWSSAGISFWLGTLYILETAGIQSFGAQTAILLAVPLAGMVLATRRVGEKDQSALTVACHVTLLAGLILSAVVVTDIQELRVFITADANRWQNAFPGIVCAELALFYLLTGATAKRRALAYVFSGLWAAAAAWKIILVVDLPESCYGPVLAAMGLLSLLLDQFTLFQRPVVAGTTPSKDDGRVPVLLRSAGDPLLVLGQLVTFFQILPALLGVRSNELVSLIVATLVSAAISAVAAGVTPSTASRRWQTVAAVGLTGMALATWLRSLDLADYQKLELLLEAMGVLLIAVGYAGRLQETRRDADSGVSLALWVGSIAATMPVLCCMLGHRWSASGPSLGDELGLITVCLLMIASGCILQIRSTTGLGGITLGVYLLVLFAHLAYHPQIAVGVYLAVGGGLIFLTGVVLSIFRDRLLALPSKIANREGIFRIIDWR